ncbi:MULTISPECIES: hypothetical protein [Vibrio]|uniref:Lipoprotein n=2 Tax=Vibrio TaxID=662 RepID=A0A4U1Z6Y6_9VIBR|nr:MULTISPECIES: hypothetical protein [Vibrio]MCC4790909.1 hypothetical protein [Vibrio splendidus]MDP2592668.1 hypothetical protein [Vibrio splendidus]OEF40305.1 hypothetical protein OAE_21055 [Vibrio cyclitrophicus 1F289]OMO32507.1 hypothetical protein BH582_09830 [Vibrio sp. 10N.222.47.A9]PMG17020.1 hypothetical protein BCU97_05925 [Vibrio splendidus]
MKKRAFILSVISISLLSGCVSQPLTNAESIPVEESKILAPMSIRQDFLNAVKTVVKRDSGFRGSACDFTVYLDGKPIVKLSPKEKFEMFLKPDIYILGAQPEGNLCALGVGLTEVEANLTNGKAANYRIGYDESSGFQVYKTAF